MEKLKKQVGDLCCVLCCLLCAGVWAYRGDVLMALIFLAGVVAWTVRIVRALRAPAETATGKKKKKR